MQMRGNIMLQPIFFLMLYKEYSYAIFTIIVVIRQNFCVNADRNYICVKGKSAGTVSMYENIKFHKILDI